MIQIFRDIEECLTLQGAAQKKGRWIQEPDLSILSKAAIVVSQGKILWVGKTKKIPKEFSKKKAKEFSLKGKTVLPGFIECHTHLVFAGSRGADFEMKFQGRSYQEIASSGGGIFKTVQETRKISEKELLLISQKRAFDFIRQGVTTLEIKSGYGLNLASELKILKIAKKLKKVRVVATYLGPHSVPKGMDIQTYFQSVLKDLKKVSRYTNRADIFIEEGFFNTDQAKEYFQEVQKLNMDIVVHTNQLKKGDGLDLALNFHAKSCDHLNFLSEVQIKKLSQSETTGVLVPTADFYIQVPYPQARLLLDQGARIALSTDYNPGTSPTQDIQFVGLLARKEMKMKLHEVINAWTMAPAYALDIQNVAGSLEIGKSADFSIQGCSWQDLFYQVGLNKTEQVYLEGQRVLN